MGARLCTLRHPISDQKSKSLGARDATGSSFREFIKHKHLMVCFRRSVGNNMRRKEEREAPEKKIVTLEDWIKASPGPKQSKKKVHPYLSQSQPRRSLISEAKDSLYLDRPMNHHNDESEEASNYSSIVRTLSGKSQNRVSFKLPHVVIFYSPDEPYCKEDSLCSSDETYDSEDSFSSPNYGGNPFDSTEEPVVRLAVYTLPHVFVSSGI